MNAREQQTAQTTGALNALVGAALFPVAMVMLATIIVLILALSAWKFASDWAGMLVRRWK